MESGVIRLELNNLDETIKNDLVKSKDYITNIMNDIKILLDKEDIKYKEGSKCNQIIAYHKKEEIYAMLYDNLGIPKKIFRLLIKIKGIKEKTYIRLKRR